MEEPKLRRVVGIGADRESGVACLTLKAAGDESARVLQYARKHGVPVVYRSGVCDLLGFLDMDEEVPDDVLEILDVLMEEIYRDFR
jgi:type III secretion system FlhB-like substrate exporter